MSPAELQAISNGYRRRVNYEAWLHGVYTLDALTAVFSAAFAGKNKSQIHRYPNTPKSDLQPQEQEDQDRLQAELYMRQMVRAGKGWGESPTPTQEEIEKKRAQVRGLQALLYNSQ